MAKIHTVEWTPAIIPHPLIKLAMNVNWSGLVGEDRQELSEFLDDQEFARWHRRIESGPPCRAVLADRRVRRGLSHASADARRLRVPFGRDRPSAREARRCNEIAGHGRRAIAERMTMQDLFYSFGTGIPARSRCTTIRVSCRTSRATTATSDLAAVDILRDRERGVPRYNQFRRLLHKDAVKSFDELTDNVEMAQAAQDGLQR